MHVAEDFEAPRPGRRDRGDQRRLTAATRATITATTATTAAGAKTRHDRPRPALA